jgi:hypothetical protein
VGACRWAFLTADTHALTISALATGAALNYQPDDIRSRDVVKPQIGADRTLVRRRYNRELCLRGHIVSANNTPSAPGGAMLRGESAFRHSLVGSLVLRSAIQHKIGLILGEAAALI